MSEEKIEAPFEWSQKDIMEFAKDKKIANVMFEIALMQSTFCKEKRDWMELLLCTAEDIIEFLEA